MSRSLNYIANRSIQATSVLQVVKGIGIVAPSAIASTISSKVLTLDTLFVTNIVLYDALTTSIDGTADGSTKLQLSKGNIINVFQGTTPNENALSYNGVYFERDVDNPDNVSLFAGDTLKLGTPNSNIVLNGSTITINASQSLFLAGNIVLPPISYDNLTIKDYITAGGNINTSANINLPKNNSVNFGDLQIYYSPDDQLKFNENIFLMLNSANVINASNIILIDETNQLDVLFDVRGNISCNSIYLTSDVNKKKNIRELNNDEMNNINKIGSYNFDFKNNDVNSYGFLAHEVQALYPSLSNGLTVNYIGFIPILLEKIKILENQISELKNKIVS
jgi:hypothetical protein